MSIQYSEKRPRLVVARAAGRVDDAVLLEHRRQLVEKGRFGHDLGLLFDLRGVDASNMTTLGVRSLATGTSKDHPVRYLALVADGDVMYGYARMYQILSNPPIEVRVFRNRVEAEAWLDGRLTAGSRSCPDQAVSSGACI